MNLGIWILMWPRLRFPDLSSIWGGQFYQAGGLARNNIAAIDATTGTATSWNPGANFCVNAIVPTGSTVYVGGSFDNIGGQMRNHIAALDATTGLAIANWNPNANNSVFTLAISDSKVYAGGAFTTISGQPRNYIAAIDAASGNHTNWSSDANSWVYALAIYGSTVYAGGEFTVVNGQPRNRIAAIDANLSTNNVTSWDPNATGGDGPVPYVRSLAISWPTIYAGGGFSNIGGTQRKALAALDMTTGFALNWNTNMNFLNGPNSEVYGLGVFNSLLYVGGFFGEICNTTSPYFSAVTTHQITINSSVANGWNMISLPAILANQSKNSVWPDTASAAFTFSNGYVIHDPIQNGRGYWVKFSSAQPVSYTGLGLGNVTISLAAGWNLIGSLSQSIQTSKITTSPSGIIASKYFGYNTTTGQYYLTETIEPGKAYWVKASQSGTLNLDISSTANIPPSTSTVQPPPPPGTPPAAPTLSGSIVYVNGIARPSLSWTSVETGYTYKLYRYFCDGYDDCEMLGNVVYQGSNLSFIDNNVLIGTKVSGVKVWYYVKAIDISNVSSPQSNKISFFSNDRIVWKPGLMPEGGDESLPQKSELIGGYPNPFNPQTNIQFAVSEPSFVSVVITNAIGQEVAILMNDYQNAGYKSVVWDASNYPSGIYFVSMQVGNYYDVKKIMLVK